MAFNLRLATLKLRQKLNFRLVKLLLLVIYLAATFSFVIHHVTDSGKGNGAQELIVEVDIERDSIHLKYFLPLLSIIIKTIKEY